MVESVLLVTFGITPNSLRSNRSLQERSRKHKACIEMFVLQLLLWKASKMYNMLKIYKQALITVYLRLSLNCILILCLDPHHWYSSFNDWKEFKDQKYPKRRHSIPQALITNGGGGVKNQNNAQMICRCCRYDGWAKRLRRGPITS